MSKLQTPFSIIILGGIILDTTHLQITGIILIIIGLFSLANAYIRED